MSPPPPPPPRARADRRPRILLGITGSIAAVKGPRLALRLAREVKADVTVVLTRTVAAHFWRDAVPEYDADAWRDFVAATASEASGEEEGGEEEVEGGAAWRSSPGRIAVHHAEEEWEDYTSLGDPVLHIELRNWADLALVAPLSAHTLGKVAAGLCDDLLTCVLRAWDFAGEGEGGKKPVLLAPAMNTVMWRHPLTRRQLDAVRAFATAGDDGAAAAAAGGREEDGGVAVVEPATKTLACGEVGVGALAELDDLVAAVRTRLAPWWEDAAEERAGGTSTSADLSSRRESMKRALLVHAQLTFRDMRAGHVPQRSAEEAPSTLAAPISPSPDLVVDAGLPLLDLDAGSFLVDLGCGDGRWLVAAASRVPGCRGLGVDVDPARLAAAEAAIRDRGLEDRVEVRRRDAFACAREDPEVAAADAVVVYLFRAAAEEIGPVLRRRLQAGEGTRTRTRPARVLSVGFALPGWGAPVREARVGGLRVYLYATQ